MPKEKSIKLNYVFNTLKLIMAIIFPIISFPYSCRILELDGIGKVAFANSVIAYFIMISTLGIPIYGVRECAKVKDDKEKLSKLSHELLILSLIAAAFSYILLFVALFLSKTLYAEKELILILSLGIIFTSIGMEWLYQAREEYFFIALRSIIFQAVALILLFTMVKSKQDYVFYGFVGVVSGVGANFVNFIFARKIINFKRFKNYEFKKHLKPILTMFGMILAVSIYTNLDSVMVKILAGDSVTGLYSAAVKFNKMLLTFVVAVGNVLIARMSYYIGNDKEQEFKMLIGKSLDFMTMVAIPIMVGLFLMSDEIILLFSGEKFFAASLTMKIITPMIIIIGFSNLTGMQILIPMGKEKYTLYSIIAGAVVDFTLNIILVPIYKENGAAIAIVAAEFCVLLVQLYFTWDMIKDSFILKNKLHYIIAAVFVVLEVIVIKYFIASNIVRLILCTIIGGLTYFGVLILFKNNIMLQLLDCIPIGKNKQKMKL